MISQVEFAVVDVETTGLFASSGDRIIEIAIIRADFEGNVLDSYVTLLNPQRDIGPTYIHGITTRNVRNAPLFKEVAGDVLSLLSGAVFVAHNVTFDKRFVEAEMKRVGCELPDFPYLCTMHLAQLAAHNFYSHKLQLLCEHFGITLKKAHSAYADALATKELMTACLGKLSNISEMTLSRIGVRGQLIEKQFWPSLPASHISCTREATTADFVSEPSYIASLVANLPSLCETQSGIQSEVEEYLALLDRVLEDRLINPDEAHKLYSLAINLGLNKQQVIQIHHIYMRKLINVALQDDAITELEWKDLDQVRTLLSISSSKYNDLLNQAQTERSEDFAKYKTITSHQNLKGMAVCFTGTFNCRINGEIISRSFAEKIAVDNGMVVKKSVTKELDLLVAADPESMSGKARKARDYGIRIIAGLVFWRMLGIEIQ